MNTPCVGKSQLFDSTDPTDHAIAASLCRTCPVINECAQLLADAQASSPAGRDCRPQGTWAGQLIGELDRCSQQPVDAELEATQNRAHAAHMNDPVRVGEVLPDVIAFLESHSPRPVSEAP